MLNHLMQNHLLVNQMEAILAKVTRVEENPSGMTEAEESLAEVNLTEASLIEANSAIASPATRDPTTSDLATWSSKATQQTMLHSCRI